MKPNLCEKCGVREKRGGRGPFKYCLECVVIADKEQRKKDNLRRGRNMDKMYARLEERTKQIRELPGDQVLELIGWKNLQASQITLEEAMRAKREYRNKLSQKKRDGMREAKAEVEDDGPVRTKTGDSAQQG